MFHYGTGLQRSVHQVINQCGGIFTGHFYIEEVGLLPVFVSYVERLAAKIESIVGLEFHSMNQESSL